MGSALPDSSYFFRYRSFSASWLRNGLGGFLVLRRRSGQPCRNTSQQVPDDVEQAHSIDLRGILISGTPRGTFRVSLQRCCCPWQSCSRFQIVEAGHLLTVPLVASRIFVESGDMKFHDLEQLVWKLEGAHIYSIPRRGKKV